MHRVETNNYWNSKWTDLHGTGKTYNAEKTTDQALEIIQQAENKNLPFFLMVSWKPPHAIFTDPPEELKSLYPSQQQLPWRENAEEKFKKKWRQSYQGYHTHITAIDAQIGCILEKLKQLKIEDNTIIIYSSDHGSMMNSNGKVNKCFPYEESIRVTFLIRYPNVIDSGLVKNELFGSIDIFPTLCGLAGIKIPSFCHGQDFSANLLGQKGPDTDSQFIMHIGKADVQGDIANFNTPFYRGVRGKRYTYTVNAGGQGQLFDNLNDPFQKNNLIADSEYLQVREQMRNELNYWIGKVENPFMHINYYKMPLEERIAAQRLAHNETVQYLKEFISRLKLSPSQETQLRKLKTSVYDKSGKPIVKNIENSWEKADIALREKMKIILTDEQFQQFKKMESTERRFLLK